MTQEKYNELKRFECGPGDFIMSCSGTIGCLYQLPDDAEPGIINQALCKFHLNGKMLPEVFLTYMRNSVDQLETKGSAIKNIGAVSFIKKMKIALPPICEQEEFAEFIRQSDKSKFNGFKSQFIEMFGDPDKVISETEYKVSDVADVQVGLVIKPTRFYSDVPTPYPAFRSLNVGSMEVRDSDWIYFTEKGMEENQRTIAHTGDVLVVRSGYPGTSCVVTPEYDGRNVVDLIIAHPDTSKILPEFLCAYTNFPHGKMQIEANQRGVAQKHFNVSLYNSMKIVVPDLDKQHAFVKILKQSDKSKFELKQAIADIDNLSKALMQQELN